MKKINIGNKWNDVLKTSSIDKEIFSVYKSELPLMVKLFDDFVLKYNLKKVKLADFGGGGGDVTDFIKKNSKSGSLIEVYCYDVNDDLLFINNSADIKINADLTELKEVDNFDVGTMRFVLNYNSKDNQLKILKNINNSLKKDSVFINWWCGVSNDEHKNKFYKLFSTKEVNEKVFRIDSFWTTWEENKQLFKEAGFEIEVVKKFIVPINNLYKSRYELSDKENLDILNFLGKYSFISYVVFKAVKRGK